MFSDSRATSTPKDGTPASPGLEKAVAVEAQTDISVVSMYAKGSEKKERRPSVSHNIFLRGEIFRHQRKPEAEQKTHKIQIVISHRL